MATPKPGEIRCPTCHRSTAPAAFCTQCGSAIPPDARARPRGMDRDELQDRIRARRSGSDPYRRGGAPDQGYQQFEPEPEDSQAKRAPAGHEPRPDYFDETATARTVDGGDTPPPDLTRERDDWDAPVAAGAAGAAAGAAAGEADDWPPADGGYAAPYQPPQDEPYVRPDYAPDYYDDEAGVYPYEYDDYEDRQPRSSGAGAFAILGFLALGVLALLGGAVLAGVFSGDPGVGEATPSPSVEASLAPVVSEAPSVAPSEAATDDPATGSEAPLPSGEPVVFDDGAVFEVQVCASNEMSFDGCAQEAEFVSGGAFVTWIGFSQASPSDTLLLVLRQDGASVADATFQLGPTFNCADPCTGYARQGFTGLSPGEYTLELLRNGEPAHAISIGVD